MAKMRIIISILFCTINWYGASGQSVLKDDFTVRQKVEHTYLSQIGVKEVGVNRGLQVEEYLQTTGLDGGYAWCAAFVAWVYTQNKVSNPNSAWSPAYFSSSKIVWQSNGVQIRNPLPGDVFGIYFISKKRIAHVGFVHRFSPTITITVEGNTNDDGSREGDGVYLKRRPSRQLHSVSNFIND